MPTRFINSFNTCKTCMQIKQVFKGGYLDMSKLLGCDFLFK